MKYRLLCFVFLLIVIASCKKQSPPTVAKEEAPVTNPDTVVYEYLKKPDSLLEAEQYDSAIFYYERAEQKYAKVDRKGFFKAINKIGKINVILGKYEQAINGLKLADSSFLLHSNLLNEAAEYCYTIGQALFYLNEPEESIKYFNLSLNFYNKVYSKHDLNCANNYLGLGNVYCFLLHDYYNGQKYFEKALEETINLADTSNAEILFRCYYNLAANNHYRKNYDKAEYYATGAFEVSKQLKNKILSEYIHTLLASIYLVKGENQKSLFHLKQVGEILTHNLPINYERLVKNKRNLAIAYSEMKKFATSINYYLVALEILKKNNLNNKDTEADILAGLGYNYHECGNDSMALSFFSKSIFLSHQNERSSSGLKLAYSMLGKYYEDKQNYDSSIFFYGKAINLVSFKTNEDDPSEGDNFVEFYDLLNSLALAKKSKALSRKVNYKYLSAALNDFTRGDSLIQIYRKNNILASDELWLSNNVQKYYREALKCIQYLYYHQPEKRYHQIALDLIEQNKARILSKSLKEYENLKEIGLPDSLVQYWQDLNLQIALWQNEYKISKKSDFRNTIKMRLLKLVERYELLNKTLEEKYPLYLSFRVSQLVPKISILNEYAKENNTIFFLYYQGDSSITALAIGPENCFLFFPKMDSNFKENLNEYQNILDHGKPLSKVEFRKFSFVAYELYKSLLKPGFDHLKRISNTQNLIIIPDQIVSAIPFESLIEKKVDFSGINYKRLEYLIKEYEISYLPSISFLDKKSKGLDKVKNFGGWGYSHLNNAPELSDLNFGKNELQKISKNFEQDLFLDNKATESNFKRYAGDYDILHLSIHGTSQSKKDLPALFFNEDKNNDGILYPYELYNIHLKSKLTVLNACETGKGKIHPGEGIFNIARGFFYAGCESLVINLWGVKDNSASKILPIFYENLGKGLTKSSSLRNAKLEYIEKSDNLLAHPSFWASTILIGSNNSIQIQNGKSNLTLSRILIISIVIISSLLIKFWIRLFKYHPQVQKKIW